MTGRILGIILLGSLLLLTPGCWNRREVDELAIVTAVGLDLLPGNKFLITSQVAKTGNLAGPTSGGQSGKPGGGESVVVVSAQGKTAWEAVQNISDKIPRGYYFGHNRLLIFSEKLARSGQLRKILDATTRHHLIRRNRLLFVTSGPARDAVELLPYLEKIPANDVFKIFVTQSETSTFPRITINTFMNRLNAKDIEPVATRLEVVNALESGPEKKVNFLSTSGLLFPSAK